MPAHGPDFKGEKMKKKVAKKGTPSAKTLRGRRSAPSKTYPVEPISRRYCALKRWPVAERYQKTGKKGGPKEGQWYLSDGKACVASFDFGLVKLDLLKPAPPKSPKGRGK